MNEDWRYAHWEDPTDEERRMWADVSQDVRQERLEEITHEGAYREGFVDVEAKMRQSIERLLDTFSSEDPKNSRTLVIPRPQRVNQPFPALNALLHYPLRRATNHVRVLILCARF
jgi:hypothetical protein